jgi:hypothetical protein
MAKGERTGASTVVSIIVMNNASIDSILFRCHCPKVMAKPVTILNANHCHEGGYAFCLLLPLLLLLAQVSRAVKHCAGLWGTFDSGNRYGVSAKRPKNRPPDNSTESKKRKPISLVTAHAGKQQRQ